MPGSTNYRGSMDAITTIIRTEACQAFTGAMEQLRIFGPTAFYFMFYEQIKRISLGLYSKSIEEPEGIRRAGMDGMGGDGGQKKFSGSPFFAAPGQLLFGINHGVICDKPTRSCQIATAGTEGA